MSESRRLSNARMKRELRVRLRYPHAAGAAARGRAARPEEAARAAALTGGADARSRSQRGPHPAAARSAVLARLDAYERLDPPRQADRHPAAAVADAHRAVDRRARRADVDAGAGLHAGHGADALGRLRDQRLGRPPLRRARQAHRGAPAGRRRDRALGGAAGRRRARVLRVPDGARDQPDDDPAVAAGGRDRVRLPVLQALLRAAAGVPRHRVLVRHPDGVRRGATTTVPALAWWLLVAQPVLGDRLRHRVRDGRPRRRREARAAHLGDHLRALRRRRGDALLRDLPRRHGRGRVRAPAGAALLRRPRRRGGLRAVALVADPRARPRCAASARSCTTTGWASRCSPGSRPILPRASTPGRAGSDGGRSRGQKPLLENGRTSRFTSWTRSSRTRARCSRICCSALSASPASTLWTNPACSPSDLSVRPCSAA